MSDQHREELNESLKQLAGDVRFRAFLKALEDLKDDAVNNAILDVTLEHSGTTQAALGEVRAYLAILNTAKEYSEKLDSV